MTNHSDRELADFHPTTGHLHSCDYHKGWLCSGECAPALYTMIMRMEDVMVEWDRVSKGPSPTTETLRRARDGEG